MTAPSPPSPPPAPPRPRRWRRRLVRLALLAGLLVVLYATRGRTLPAWGRWLDVGEPPRDADYALVLGGGSDARPFVAAGLYKAGRVRGVLVPRVRPSPDELDGVVEPEAEVTRRALLARGVPADRVTVLEGEADSTFDEARALARFLDGRPDATVAVVTHDFHTRRARAVFRSVLGDRAGRLHFVSTPSDGYSAADWWTTEDGFTTYLTETIKSVYYAARY